MSDPRNPRQLPHQNDDSLRDLCVPLRPIAVRRSRIDRLCDWLDRRDTTACILVGLIVGGILMAFIAWPGEVGQPQQDQQVAEVSK